MAFLLLYAGKDYPCLRGAGLAMADSEAFLLSVFIALPCLVWGVLRLSTGRAVTALKSWQSKLLNWMAVFTVSGATVFLMLAILLIFFTSHFPLQYICRQPWLSWLFQYPL